MHRVLLVEDCPDTYVLVNQALVSLVELDWAKNLTEGRTRLKQDKYSLVLLDMELPDGNGIELCTELQAMDPTTATFFLTANSELSTKVLGFSAGADDYITKPIVMLELRARV